MIAFNRSILVFLSAAERSSWQETLSWYWHRSSLSFLDFMPNSPSILIGVCHTAHSLGPNCTYTSIAECRLLPSLWCVRPRQQHFERGVWPDPSYEGKSMRERLWRDLFWDPSQWWDHRSEKVNPRYPDFRHKKTQQGLWIIDKLTPPWGKVELATERDVPPDRSDRKKIRERLWREFFSDPSQWWDHRNEKVNPRYPDFKHKETQQGLWIIDNLTPPWVKVELTTKRDVSPDISDQKLMREWLWREFFSDPSQWWDHRNEKVNPRYPDFKHKTKGLGLWLGNSLTPPWVAAEMATMVPGVIQSHIFSWHVKLRRHVEAGEYNKTTSLFQQMQREGIVPDKFTFVAVLNACSNLGSLEEGRGVHKQIIQRGCESEVYVANGLVDMYAKCGSIEDAWSVFNRMPERSVVSWNVMIGGYVKSEQGLKALELFRTMQQEGVEPDAVTFVGALRACAILAALEEGRRIHEQIIRQECELDIYVATCLVDMYAKCRSIEDAWIVFNKMRQRNVVSWTAMIVGYVRSEQGLKALELFRRMQQEGLEPDAVTFVGALSACASIAALEEGRRVHEQIVRRGYESNNYVANCLVDMYAKCGSIEDAWIIFNKMPERGVVSWNAMIGGYAKSLQGLKALELFRKMQQNGVEPNTVTFVGVLSACASVLALEEGRRAHEHIICKGCESDVYVANCLVDMYAKCGSIEDAWSVFNKMRERDVVSWNAMIVGSLKSEQGLKALELFRKMQQEGVEPDTVTFVAALNACASVVALLEGRRVHKQIIRRGCESDIYVANCLVDMYAKCGSSKNARTVFNKMRERSVVSWNAMIGGYAMHGQSEEAIELFEQMGKDGVEIDEITFTCLLSTCSHGGLVEEGFRYFNMMTSQYNVLPTREHYGCMVDLLGRAGRLEEAEEMAEEMTKRMPMEVDIRAWSSLLGACRIHGNIEIAERCAKRCWELNPKNVSAARVVLSNIYAAAAKWDKSAPIDEERVKIKVWKVPGRTWIQMRNAVHSFMVDDKEHPQLRQIHIELYRLSVKMHEGGYIPDMTFLSTEEEEEECHMCHQRERLVLANGLINSRPGSQNPHKEKLWACPECPSASSSLQID